MWDYPESLVDVPMKAMITFNLGKILSKLETRHWQTGSIDILQLSRVLGSGFPSLSS